MSTTFSSLQYYNYRVWFGAALVANVGTWMQRVAQDWLVLSDLTDNSGVAVGVVTALQFAPVLALSAWAGLLADRLPRRRLLMATQGAMGLLALGLGALVLSGNVELWHVYVFAGLLGVVSAFDNPVRQTFVAEMVPRQALQRRRAQQRVVQRGAPRGAGRRRAAHRGRRLRLAVHHQRRDVRGDHPRADVHAHARAPRAAERAAREGSDPRGHPVRARADGHHRHHGRRRRRVDVRSTSSSRPR